MRIINIDPVPNESFSVTINGDRWDFILKQATNSMTCTLSLNNEEILSGQRIVAGTPIIPYAYLSGRGNFVILTENDQLPEWEEFGNSQLLIYASPSEIDSVDGLQIERPVLVAYSLSVIVINSLSIVV